MAGFFDAQLFQMTIGYGPSHCIFLTCECLTRTRHSAAVDGRVPAVAAATLSHEDVGRIREGVLAWIGG